MIVITIESTLNINDCFGKILRLRKESAEKVFTTEELLRFWDNEELNRKILAYVENEVLDSGHQFLYEIGLSFKDIITCTDKAKRLYTALYLNWLVARLVEDSEQ